MNWRSGHGNPLAWSSAEILLPSRGRRHRLEFRSLGDGGLRADDLMHTLAGEPILIGDLLKGETMLKAKRKNFAVAFLVGARTGAERTPCPAGVLLEGVDSILGERSAAVTLTDVADPGAEVDGFAGFGGVLVSGRDERVALGGDVVVQGGQVGVPSGAVIHGTLLYTVAMG